MMELYNALGASAGSGKTFALTVRYIALMLKRKDPRKILAITFTKKATKEMADRIVQTFLNLHTKQTELNEICKLLDKNEKEVIAIRDKIKGNFLSSDLRIQTFDAFFSSVLRLFSLNLGLMPDFENTNELENETMNFLIKNSDDKLIKKIASYIHFSEDSQNTFFETLNNIYEKLSDISFKNSAVFPNDKNMLQDFQELRDYALKLNSNTNYVNLFNKNTKDFISNVDLEKNYFKNVKNDKEFINKFDNFMKSSYDYYKEFEAYKLKELFELLKSYKKARFDINKTKNLLSFSDITKLTYKLVNSQDYRQMLYFRLDSKITDILIDEFQDTNVSQYNIIKPLIEECVSGIGQNGLGSFFYVGDIKQSIYRFRGSKKELFYKPMDEYKQIVFNTLDKNYRSDKFLVEFVNETFKDKIQDYKEQIPQSQNDGYVEICSCEKERIYNTVLDKVKFLKSHGINENEIAILCWKNNDLDEIKNLLQQNKIKSVSKSSVLIINSKYVAMLIQYAKFCYFNDDYYGNNLYEFYGEIPQKIEINFKLSLKEILYQMACKIKLDLSDKNLLKFFEIISKYENFVHFILEIDNEKESSTDEMLNGVNLLSVHGSKGLEFNHVIVVDMMSNKNKNSPKFIFEYDLKSEKWQIRLNNSAFEKFGDQNFINLKNLSEKLDYEDKLNQIYVAFTRAKNSLIIIAKTDGNGNSPSLFKKYTSNKMEMKILDLQDKILGKIEQKSKDKPNQIKKDEKIEFINISKQKITEISNKKELNFKYALFGTALHFMIEMMDKFNEENLENAYILLENRYGSALSENEMQDIKCRVNLLIKNDNFLNLINDSILLKEQDYIFETVLKRIDLLAINEKTKEIYIFDYKSSKNILDENIVQVKNYVQNLQNICLKYKISGYLVFLLQENCELKIV